MQTLLMVNPDGESGEVLMSNVPKALQQGYRRGVKLRAPNSQIVIAPMDLVNQYLVAGFSIVHE